MGKPALWADWTIVNDPIILRQRSWPIEDHVCGAAPCSRRGLLILLQQMNA